MTTFTTYATATFATGNIVVVQSAENMLPGLPITFLGNTFGNVQANATYYIGNITFGFPTSNITLTSLPGGSTVNVSNGSGNMVTSFKQGGQLIIPTVAPGEPLNQAFDAINVNFDQIFAAGPVGSNIQIDENTIYTLNTNGNLVLNPNGIGNIVGNAHVVPDRDRVRNLGAPLLRWNTIYAQNIVGNVTGNTDAGGSNGQIQYNANGILAGANGFTFLANTSSVSIVGTLTAGNVLTPGIVSSTSGVYGDIYTTMIDSGDSSAILVLSEVNMLSDLSVAQSLQVDQNISATGNISGNNLIGGNVLFGSGVVSGTGNIYANKIFANIQGNIDAAGNLYEVQFNTTGDQLGANANFTYNFANNVLTVANGNIVGGNVLSGTVSATGNITANYYFGNGSQLTGITADNVNADDLVGNILSGNVLYSNLITVGNLVSLSVVGNTTTGNLDTAGAVSATGNVTAGNVLFGSGIVSGTGNIYANKIFANIQGNIDAAGNLYEVQFNTTGDQLGANANFTYDFANNVFTVANGNIATGNVSAVGNISANYFFGNGSQLTGIDATSIQNGNSNVRVAANANVTVGVAGVSNVAVFTPEGIDIAGNVSATGNASASNFFFGSGIVSGTGNIYANKIFANIQGNIDAAGNLYEIQFNTTGDQLGANANFTYDFANNVLTVANGNIQSGNVLVDANVSAVGNVHGSWFVGNVDAEIVSATGNITGGNVLFGAGIVSGTGNIYANKIFANIQGNIDAAGNLYEVQFNGPGDALSANSNFTYDSANNALTVNNGNITGGNILTAGQVSATGNVYGSWFVGNVDAETVNATANITGGNILTAGEVSATGSGTFGNVLTGGTVSATSTIQGGNILTPGEVSAGGSLTGGNIFTGGIVSAVSTVTGGNLATAGSVTATGTITGGNIVTAGFVSATGEISGGNISTTGNVTASNVNATTGFFGNINLTGDITVNSLTSNTFVSATGNVVGGNILTGGLISATGNVSGNYFIGNGAFLTGIDTTLISNGNTNVQTYANGNVAVTVAGVANTVVFTVAGTDITGNANITGNISGGNIATAGEISATGNVSGANVNTTTVWSNSDLNLQPVGNVALGNRYITGVRYPSADQDAASKIYVDNLVSTAISYHEAVFAATTGTLATATGGTVTYNQPGGAGNGIGATLTTTGSFNLIDTANVQTAGTRILVKNEANAAHNGVYVWSNATVITRSSDADTAGVGNAFALGLNDYFFVTNGNVNSGSAWIVDAPTGNIVFGTSNIEFAQFSQSQVYSANVSAGLSLSGTVFSAKVDNNTTAFDGGGNIIVKAGANLTTPNIGAATGSSLSVTGNVEGGNIVTVGYVTATGNVQGGNIVTAGNVTATGNITGNYFIGNGSQLTGVTAASVDAGNLTGNTLSSNVLFSSLTTVGTLTSLSVSGNVDGGNIATAGVVSASGTVTGGNIATAGSVSATGAVTAGNVFTGGAVSATGTGTFGNVLTGGVVSATSSILGGNVLTPGEVSAGGSLTGGNIFTGGQISAVSTITGGNIATTGYVTATGNVTGGNIVSAGQISATGNITAPIFLGNLEGTTASLLGNITGGNLLTSGQISATANITGGNILFGSGIVSGTGNIYANNIFANISGNIDAAGNLYEVQFNTTGDILGANANFTYDSANNVFTVANGNIVGGNVLVNTDVSATGNITGNNVVVGNILIPSSGNVTLGNVNINDLAEPAANSDAATKFYVDSVAANVLPIISNQTISPDGISNTFVLNQTATDVGILLTINGITQTPATNYTVSGNSLTMAETPLSSDIIQVRYLSGTQVGGGGSNYANANVVAYGQSGWAGNIIPSGNAVYSLGNATNQWKDLYVSGNTIYIGNVPMTIANSVLSVAGNAVLTSNTTTNISTTGNITAANVFTGGAVSATGNVSGANFRGNTITVTGTGTAVNASSGNILTNQVTGTQFNFLSGLYTVNLNASGATANYTLNLPANAGANGQVLTTNGTGGLSWTTPASTYGNANVATFLANYGSNTISTTGNITAGNIVGNISITGNVTGTSANVSLVAGSYTATFDNTGVLTLPTIGGDEGGEINFGAPTANTTLTGPVKLDVYQDRIRFFDGSTKGAYIDLSQAAAGVGTLLNNRVSGVVNAGTFVTMDNIRATVTTTGNRGLSLATVSGSFTYDIGGTYAGAGVGSSGTSAGGQTLTTTPTSSIFGWGFTNQGDIATYIITNISSLLTYRITLQIGGGFNNNRIVIERLI